MLTPTIWAIVWSSEVTFMPSPNLVYLKKRYKSIIMVIAANSAMAFSLGRLTTIRSQAPLGIILTGKVFLFGPHIRRIRPLRPPMSARVTMTLARIGCPMRGRIHTRSIKMLNPIALAKAWMMESQTGMPTERVLQSK